MAKKSIIEQIKDTQQELKTMQTEKKQKEHQLEKLQAREREKERKERTRNLIEKGGLLESIHPSIKSLSKEQLKAFLQQVLLSDQALQLLSEMAETKNTE